METERRHRISQDGAAGTRLPKVRVKHRIFSVTEMPAFGHFDKVFTQ
jgi:hypothetical protein